MPKESVSILSYSQGSCPIPHFSPIRALFELGGFYFFPSLQPGRVGWSKSSADFVQRSRLLVGEATFGRRIKATLGAWGVGVEEGNFWPSPPGRRSLSQAPCVQIWFCGPDRRRGSALQLLSCGGCKSNRGTEALGRLPLRGQGSPHQDVAPRCANVGR